MNARKIAYLIIGIVAGLAVAAVAIIIFINQYLKEWEL